MKQAVESVGVSPTKKGSLFYHKAFFHLREGKRSEGGGGNLTRILRICRSRGSKTEFTLATELMFFIEK